MLGMCCATEPHAHSPVKQTENILSMWYYRPIKKSSRWRRRREIKIKNACPASKEDVATR